MASRDDLEESRMAVEKSPKLRPLSVIRGSSIHAAVRVHLVHLNCKSPRRLQIGRSIVRCSFRLVADLSSSRAPPCDRAGNVACENSY